MKLLKKASALVGSGARALVALIGILGICTALANYTMTQGTGTTFGSIVVSTVHYAQMLLCDPTTPSQCAGVNNSGQMAIQAPGPNTAANSGTTSQLTLTSSTAAYSVGNNVASSATGTSVIVPSFSIANSGGSAKICYMDMFSDDSTTGVAPWAGVTIQVDLWRAAPTFATGNGDRLAYVVATGSANYIGSFSGTFQPSAGDGAYARLTPTTGDCIQPKLASGSSISWTEFVLTSTAVTAASKHQTLLPEITN